MYLVDKVAIRLLLWPSKSGLLNVSSFLSLSFSVTTLGYFLKLCNKFAFKSSPT